jgi:hypothetical protein
LKTWQKKSAAHQLSRCFASFAARKQAPACFSHFRHKTAPFPAVMLLAVALLLLGLAPVASSAGSAAPIASVTVATNIINNATRLDAAGHPLNAHQGSMIRGSGNFSGRYYLYGDWFRACKPQGYGCKCVGDPPGMQVHGSKFTKSNLLSLLAHGQTFSDRDLVNAVGIYSSADFESWKEEGGG